jgi:hypothetical protein
MPAQFALPPDSRSVGSGNPPADMNAVVDALTAMGAGFNVLNAAFAGGADPAGVTDSTNAWQDAMNALPAAGGVIIVPPGNYLISSTLTNAVTPTYIVCPGGRWATQVNFTGTGDCIRMYNPVTVVGLTSSSNARGGGVLGLTIDGTNAGAGSAGLHIGDGEQYELNVAAQNFSGTSSIGVHLDNTVWWTEKCHGTIFGRNNTQNVVFDVSGAATSTNSFGYLDLTCYIYALANQDGVVVQNGALPYHGHLTVKGNFAGSASAVTNAVLRITGAVPAGHPGAGGYSQIAHCHLDIQAEVNTFANQPSTIIFNAAPSANAILGCYGIMDFTQGPGTFTPSNVTISASAQTLTYEGLVMGDVNLNPAGILPQPVTIGSKVLARNFMSGANGNTFTEWGDFFAATLSASITVNLAPSGQNTVAAPQRKTIILTQAASGGPYTVTWPQPGSPTTATPAVYWPGGVTPVMSPAANAVDVYVLETIDGVRWYGQARQAAPPGQFLCPPSSYAPASQTLLSTFSTTFEVFGTGTTAAAGSTGGEISTIASWGGTYGGNGVLDVAATAGFPASGTLLVSASGPTYAVVTYTGTSGGTSFTGCAYVSGSATGTVVTGGNVTNITASAISTGSFTAPPSGSVMVTASFTAQSASNDFCALALAAHGTITPIVSNVVEYQDSANTNPRPCTVQFLVTSLTPGSSYNFDLLGSGTSNALFTILAFGQSATSPSTSRGAPVLMTVQAV